MDDKKEDKKGDKKGDKKEKKLGKLSVWGRWFFADALLVAREEEQSVAAVGTGGGLGLGAADHTYAVPLSTTGCRLESR